MRLARCAATSVASLLCLLLAPPRAAGVDLPCAPVQNDAIHLDGLLNDWREEQPVRIEDAGQRTCFVLTLPAQTAPPDQHSAGPDRDISRDQPAGRGVPG